jgi:Flp pilus assembly protein TadG
MVGKDMNWWRKRMGGRRGWKRQEGQSLVETAIALPLLLGIAFNVINFGYMWFLVLALSAAPRQGVQYSAQGGQAMTTTSAPDTTHVSNLVYENLTNAIKGATTSNAGVQVCTSAKGVIGSGSSQVALCDQFGGATARTPAADPEAPTFVLHRVDVEYTITPIIPGSAFMVVLPGNLHFHRQVSMRNLY